MKIDTDSYTFPFSKCPCHCGGAIDANGVVVVSENHRPGDDPPLFEDVMTAVAGGQCYGDGQGVGSQTGCNCGGDSTYGAGAGLHSFWCREYKE